MNQLRQAAQAVVKSKHHVSSMLSEVGRKQLRDLEEALAEPCEPVAYPEFMFSSDYYGRPTMAVKLCGQWILPDGDIYSDISQAPANFVEMKWVDIETKLAAPPSLDALIAEAVTKEREACAQVCDTYGKGYGQPMVLMVASEIRAREQK